MKANILNIQKTYSEIPGTWEFEGVTYQGYEHFTDLHFAHGWRDVVIPKITETQKLSNDFILVGDILTKEVIELNETEIEGILNLNKETFLTKLQLYSIDLRLKAKASAIGKKGSQDYIFAQVEMYELKYKIAKGLVSGQYFTDLLTNESTEFGLSIEDFKALIISMYESSEATYQQFLFMIERCRTFIQTLIENNDFTKVDSAFALIDTLDVPEQAQSLMASILEL